jgi:tRNA (guanine37-N1)-methyltransferase
VDDRLCQKLIDDELSIGDYVLSGGEIAAMAVIDAVTRLIPGVLGAADSAERDSFSDGLLEHAHFTRPPCFEGEEVPAVLASGHHGEIARWRLESSLMRTLVNRPDLLQGRGLNPEEVEIVRRWRAQLGRLLAADGGD